MPQYLLDTDTAQAVTGRKNFNGADSLQRWGQQAVKRLVVTSRTLVAEPSSPVNGAIYLIPTSGTVTGTAWGAAPLNVTNGDVVARTENAWEKIAPFDGMQLFIAPEGVTLERVAGAWRDAGADFLVMQIFS